MPGAPSAAKSRLLVQHSPVMIWRAGLDDSCNYFNQTWLAFTGRTLEQGMGREPRGRPGPGTFIAKAIARAHRGGLEVNSADDETMFRLVLPRQIPTEELRQDLAAARRYADQ